MKKWPYIAFVLVLLSVALPISESHAQATPEKWCLWYRSAAPSHDNIQMLAATFPACGGSVAHVPNGYVLWVWCREGGCWSARQALTDFYIQTKRIPDWRGQVR
ncbi:hypothetical protein [Roseibium sp.]|uniref:hypothetical protein n=1 Tax=Roseibium sp. TaxID=1936156 RepID=UPI003A96BF36